ncbi:MAG: ribosome small subunit-dependent GTPase A [Myxococcales bacterium]|nr:ribosome small subunit-dependent GTPase A [Myxococcales bacterium]
MSELNRYGLTAEQRAELDQILETLTYATDVATDRAMPCVAGRVIRNQRERLSIAGANGIFSATVSGRLRHRIASPLDAPAVGDWVICRRQTALDGGASSRGEADEIDDAQVEAIAPRHSLFVRRSAGRTGEPQVIAANVDRVLIVTAVGNELNPRRIERYVTAAWASGAEPLIVLNKCDRTEGVAPLIAELRSAAPGVPLVATSALSEAGPVELEAWLDAGSTVAFVGSSGVGKSTLVNRLLKEAALRTHAVREGDDKGRHTTTHRELFVCPSGLIVIDTPGMREFGLYDAGDALELTFPDVVALIAGCRFRNCRHRGEPDCAVDEAVRRGVLPRERVQSYLRLVAESADGDERSRDAANREKHRQWKSVTKGMRKRQRLHEKLGLKH